MKRSIVTIFLFMVILMFAEGQTTRRIWEGTKLHKKNVTLTSFLPEVEPTAAIIVCPGGSYCWHDMETEGIAVAKWLQSNGIAVFLLKYRVQGVFPYMFHTRLISRGHRHPDMIEDFQRALQLVREEWDATGIPVGAMGFSAGGHLVMLSAELSQTNFLLPLEIKTNVLLRPDFVASIYPVVSLSASCTHKRSRRALLGEYRKYNKTLRDSLSLERHVPKDCPPVFLANCIDDPIVHYHNSEMLDSALTAQNIEHRYIQFKTGGHGFGADDEKGTEECRVWKVLFLEWLKQLSM